MSTHAQVSKPPMFSKVTTEIREYGGLPYRKPKSFMDLPLEVKDMIYHILLQIDAIGGWPCINPLRTGCCTTILCLNRNIRAEAVRIFERLTPNFKFEGRFRRIARNWHDDHGPLTPTMSCLFLKDPLFHQPRLMPELALLRLRKIIVDFIYPAKVEDDNGTEVFDDRALWVMRVLREQLKNLQEVVLKSKSLVEVHFRVQIDYHLSLIQTDDGSEPSQYMVQHLSEDNSELFALFHPFLYAARGQSFRITAKENEDFRVSSWLYDLRFVHPMNRRFISPVEYHDPLVKYINTAAQAGLGASLPQEELPFAVLGEVDGEVGFEYHPSAAITKSPDYINYPQVDYELTPECRKCNETFKEKADLQLHLKQHQKHKIPFTKRGSDDLFDWWTKIEISKQKCRVCGKIFWSTCDLLIHCKDSEHFRCRVCGRVFYTAADLREQCKKSEHVRCRVCRRVFNTAADLHEHCKDSKHVRCRVCGRDFCSAADLHEHCQDSKHFRTREQLRVGKWKQDNSS